MNTGEKALDYNLRSAYGITIDQYADMLESQKFLCGICGLSAKDAHPGRSVRLFVDHDHKTKIVRGLLCDGCNRGLGGFKDDPELLKKAAEYLLNVCKLG